MLTPDKDMIDTLNKLFKKKTSMIKPENKYDFEISYRDIEYGVECYNTMKKKDGPLYEIFGECAMGFICFSLYKSSDSKIYLIEVNVNKPTYFMELSDNTLTDW